MLDPNDIVPTGPPGPGTPPWFAYGDQDENGIDLSLIRENLKLTPLERARRGDAHRIGALQLLEYGRLHRENVAVGKIR
jgi:hypothetical protein